MKKIAFYGKGGIGKSTTVSNIAACLAKLGYKVIQIGCDPKGDSNINHNLGKKIPTVLDCIKKGNDDNYKNFVVESKKNLFSIESGGPLPGIGCAGRGIIVAFDKLNELGVFDIIKPDFVLYDVLGDVVCGGFAMPLRNGYADELYVITSGEMMSLYAASNICYAANNTLNNPNLILKGLILNQKNIDNEIEITKKASLEMNTKVKFIIPRDSLIQEAEKKYMTVVEMFEDSKLTNLYMEIARKIANE